MVPDLPSVDDPLIVTAVFQGGWVARAKDRTFRFTGCIPSTGEMPEIGDVVGYVGAHSGTVMVRPVTIHSTGSVEITYHFRDADHTQCTEPAAEPTAKPNSKKPYLALNQAPWQKRKKGRH